MSTGLRQKRSTCDTITRFLDENYESLDESKSTIALFLDFSKDFDPAKFDILLKKLD